MQELYDQVAIKCSKLTTNEYSTSFSLGIKVLDKKFHMPVYSIYGFVRFADEIVDTFHGHNKADLLAEFKADTYKAIEQKISLNPILHSFQLVVNQYGIERKLIEAFLYSMELDLSEKTYDQEGYEEYIYGSAEVVGLMCLRVFCEGDNSKYEELVPFARALGSAFQKINFLRDLNADFDGMGRLYFPNISIDSFDEQTKTEIEQDIAADFATGFEGIKKLPKGARFGVYVAYTYYLSLFKKISAKSIADVRSTRIRISDTRKIALMIQSYFKHQLNLV
ncbi:MAG: phytoene/squalene synthase family protein [Flavobacteriales bacterium]|nr:phytoene/squalene synthase family protein [Flavobacteriales bacterium]